MSVIVAGSSASRSALLNGILQYDELCAASDTTTTDDSSQRIEEHGSSIVIDLHSKYYDAKLRLLTGPDDDVDGWEPSLQSSDPQFPVEGFIYVTDTGKMSEGVLARLAVALGNQSELSVKLLVHWRLHGSPDLDDSERTLRFEWSLDHGFEFIEIDATNATQGWKSREKEGLPRLIEALHSNMWSTMVRKEPNIYTPPSSSVFTVVEATTASEDRRTLPAATSILSSGVEHNTPPEPPVRPSHSPNTSLSVKPADANIDINGDDDKEDAELMGKFEEIIGQARQYRQQAAEGIVSDEERLSRAEHVARALAMMLNINDDDDDED